MLVDTDTKLDTIVDPNIRLVRDHAKTKYNSQQFHYFSW